MANTTIDIGPELPEVEYDDTPPNTGPRLTTTANCAEENPGDTCNNYYPTEQEYLQQKAANTNTGGTLWTNFPKGSGPLTGDPTPLKDPLGDFFLDFPSAS